MPIDPSREKLILLAQAAKFFPTRPSLKTLYRWTSKGCRGVVLETCQAASARATSREAVERFFAELTRRTRGTAAASKSAMRTKVLAAVDRELDAAGI